ncbi:MAG TPA: hypothetical protein VLB01_08030 [Thermodesulfobacteriota bacterium]|nr:hypothetical protein [Thermodesulfobacteriota bacterium]
MGEQEETESSDEKVIPISPSLEAVKGATHFPRPDPVVNWRSMQITLVAILVGLLGGLVAQGLMLLIRFITTLCFYGSYSAEFLSPTVSHLGVWVIFVPVIGGLIVGMMAYYGFKGIRGHGIPEAMEQVLINQSRIPQRPASNGSVHYPLAQRVTLSYRSRICRGGSRTAPIFLDLLYLAGKYNRYDEYLSA